MFWRFGLLVGLLSLPSIGASQVPGGTLQGVSIRFATAFHHFVNADEHPLIDGRFSTANLGLSYKFYGYFGHAEFGLSIGHKETEEGFSFPVVANDFPAEGQEQATRFTYYEVAVKAGPRVFWHIYPKFGVTAGYRSRQDGFYEADASEEDRRELNELYLGLPIGFTVDLPTSFGTVGAGAFYEFGLTNVMRGLGWSEGSRLNAISVELHATVRTK